MGPADGPEGIPSTQAGNVPLMFPILVMVPIGKRSVEPGHPLRKERLTSALERI